MAVYRFRVTLDDYDEIFRDVDILSGQTFEDFHHCIQEAFQFDKKHAASFFICDDSWRKGEEITLREEDLNLDEEDIKRNITRKYLMSKTKISSFIQHPHQRFLYVFDPQTLWEFMIELIKIINEEPGKSYPCVFRKVGNPPRQYKITPPGTLASSSTKPAIPDLINPDNIDEDDIYNAIASDDFEIPEPDTSDDKTEALFSGDSFKEDMEGEDLTEDGDLGEDDFNDDFYPDEEK